MMPRQARIASVMYTANEGPWAGTEYALVVPLDVEEANSPVASNQEMVRTLNQVLDFAAKSYPHAVDFDISASLEPAGGPLKTVPREQVFEPTTLPKPVPPKPSFALPPIQPVPPRFTEPEPCVTAPVEPTPVESEGPVETAAQQVPEPAEVADSPPVRKRAKRPTQPATGQLRLFD